MRLREKTELFPPIACRLLARRKHSGNQVVALTDAELQIASGLPIAAIKRLSWEASWSGVSVGEMLAFTTACGVDFDNPAAIKKNVRFLKQADWRHITRSPDRARFEELYRAYASSR